MSDVQISKPEIDIISWDPIAIWKYKIATDECTICKNKMTYLCATCMDSSEQKHCPVSSGKCGHAFHHHCIQKWLMTNNTCPIDRVSWSFQTNDMSAGQWKKIVKKGPKMEDID